MLLLVIKVNVLPGQYDFVGNDFDLVDVRCVVGWLFVLFYYFL